MREFNLEVISYSHSRLVQNGNKIDAFELGLSNKDRHDLIAIIARSEESLGNQRIEDIFDKEFFNTNFWIMWSTTFAFQTWHSATELRRYLIRFIQEFPRIHTLAGVKRTRYNQYDSIVLPIEKWLLDQGVKIVRTSNVIGLDFELSSKGKSVDRIHLTHEGESLGIDVRADDLVFVTNGSMTAASTMGSTSSPASHMITMGVTCC
jgi:oleate hydratase